MSYKRIEIQQETTKIAHDIDKINITGDRLIPAISSDGKTLSLSISPSITTAYNSVTDGTNTATAISSDTLKFRTANNILSVLITNNEPVHGDNLLLTINQGNIDHTAINNIGTNSHAQVDAFITKHNNIDKDTLSSGIIFGGFIDHPISGIAVQISAGEGYINSGTTYEEIIWGNMTVDTVGDGINYIGINGASVAVASLSELSSDIIKLGTVYVESGNTVVVEVFPQAVELSDLANKIYRYLGDIGPIVVNGVEVSEKLSPNFLELDIAGGEVHLGLSEYILPATSTFSKYYYTTDQNWVIDTNDLNKVNTTQWNDLTQPAATALKTMTDGYWKKDIIIRGSDGHAYYIFSQAEYQTYIQASVSAIPTLPQAFIGNMFILCTIISKKGSTSIAKGLDDIRPNISRIFGYGVENGSDNNGFSHIEHEHYIGGYSNSSTGLLVGGACSINTNTAKFNISAGTAIFIDNATDPLKTEHVLVSWNEMLAVTIINLATQTGTYIGIDATGSIIQSATPFQYEQTRTIIPICFLFHASNTFIKAVLSLTPAAFDPASRLNDIATAIGIMNLQGNQFSANGVNLKLNKTSGKSYALGVNFNVDKKIPDVSQDGAQTAPSFQLVHRDGLGGFPPVTTTDIDPNNFDNGVGGIPEITNVDFTTHTITGGDYWTINSPSVSYYVWYTVDSTGTDPAPTGKTGILVEILSTDISTQVASNTQAVLDAHAAFSASVVTNVITVTNTANGVAMNAADFNAGVSISVTQEGFYVEPIPTGNWVAIPIYYIPGVGINGVRVQYPQQTFTTKLLAEASIPDPTFVTSPNLANATLRTYLIVQQGTTNLSNASLAEFIQQGKFSGGIAAGSSSGGGGSGAPVDASYIVTASDPTLTNEKVIGSDFFITNAYVSGVAGIIESKLSLNYPTHTNVNDPTAGEKAALAGTAGTPGGGNRYVTDTDTRMTNARTPISHLIIDNTAVGPYHSIAGGVSGYVFKATGATTAQLMQLAHSEVSGAGTNTHAQIDTFIASKGNINGLATLDANTKVPNAQIVNVLAVTDLSTYTSISGSGATALLTTITTPTSGQVLSWSGTNWINQSLANQLYDTGLNGIVVRTSLNTTIARALVPPSAGLTISNADGVAGNPTFVLANDLGAIEALDGVGLYSRTATDTWAARTITGTTSNITVSNGDGAAGNPTINLATVGTPGTYSTVTTDAFGRITAGSTTQTTETGGTGLTSIGTANQILGVNNNATALEYKTLSTGAGISLTNGAGSITIDNTGVTSVTGTANQIVTSASTGGITLSLPTSILATSLTLSSLTPNSFLYSGTAGALTTTAAPTSGQLLIGSTGAAPVRGTLTAGTGITITNGAGSITINSTNVGTVTSVAISGGATGLTTSGGPITSSGTITIAGTLAAVNGGTGQSSYAIGDILYASTTTTLAKLADVATGNALIAGGVGVAPSWGKINLTTHVSGILPIANGGTALSTTPTNGQLLIGNGTNYTLSTITAGSGITVTNSSGGITIAANASGGSVTSVGLAAPSIFTVSGSPVTTSGTLTLALATQVKNTVFAGPTSGANAAPTFRTLSLANNDISDLTITSAGVGDELVYNGTSWVNHSSVWSGNITSISGTTQIIPGTTPPLITDGTVLVTQIINPFSTASRYVIEFGVSASASLNNNIHSACLFRTVGGVSTYLGGAVQTYSSGGNSTSIIFIITDAPGTLSPVTYTITFGTNSGTWYINRRVSENTFGGVKSGWKIGEE